VNSQVHGPGKDAPRGISTKSSSNLRVCSSWSKCNKNQQQDRNKVTLLQLEDEPLRGQGGDCHPCKHALDCQTDQHEPNESHTPSATVNKNQKIELDFVRNFQLFWRHK
jgi:hypothetical protein